MGSPISKRHLTALHCLTAANAGATAGLPGADNMKTNDRIPTWVTTSLKLAGWYNLVWGGLVVVFPNLFFRISGWQDRPAEPFIWQALGMVIGVYGVGYLISANNPIRHWPIILVGLLGKVLGPIGFLFALWQDAAWLSLIWMIVLNDLIWWPSFCAALWIAARENQPGMTVDYEKPADPLRTLFNEQGQTIYELSVEKPTLVVFLRHAGCTFCREALADLRTQREEIEKQNVTIALVHMGTEAQGQAFFGKYELQDLPQFSDPERCLYQFFDLQLGRPGQLFGPRVWFRGFAAAILRRHGVGKLQGNGFQMAGTFLIHQGKIVNAHPLKDASDRPDYCSLATPQV